MAHRSEDDEVEYQALMREACGDPGAGEAVTAQIGARLHRLLLDAEQASRHWAATVMDEDAIAGHQARAKAWLKKQSIVLVAHDGTLVGTFTRVGVRRRSGGKHQYTQKLFEELTWAEVEEHLKSINTMLGALLVNKVAASRLLDLRALAPDSVGPGDAAGRLGTTIEQWLGVA